jgi:hypothetical protein
MSLVDDICEPGLLTQFATPPSSQDTEDIIRRIKADLHPGQLAFVEDSDTQILGLTAGYGAGKTHSLNAKSVVLAVQNQGHTGIVMEPTYPMIRDIWKASFDRFLEQYGIPYTYRTSPLPEYILHLEKPTTILCRSIKNGTFSAVGVNAAWALFDEIDILRLVDAQNAFEKILGRLRVGNKRQFAVASTPEGYRWLFQQFGKPEMQQREDRRLIKMRTSDNPHLPPDFIERLQENYDSASLAAYLNGDFTLLNSTQVYDRFDRAKHVIQAAPVNLDNEPRHWGIDFNIGNCNAVCGVRLGQQFLVIDEVKAHDTDALAAEIKRRSAHVSAPVYVYPDASGANRSTNASKTDIELLQSAGLSVIAGRSNPLVRDRVAAVQALLENGKGEIRLQILAKCERMIECLELQSYSERNPEEPDKEAGYDHLNDSLGYAVWALYNPLHARSGRGTGIRLY